METLSPLAFVKGEVGRVGFIAKHSGNSVRWPGGEEEEEEEEGDIRRRCWVSLEQVYLR